MQEKTQETESKMQNLQMLLNFQVERTKNMDVRPEVTEFLQEIRTRGDWKRLEWFCLCAIDRMSLEELRQMESNRYSVEQIRRQRQEHLKKLFVGLDPMHTRIREMESEVKSVCEESRRTRQILENNVEKALEKQYAAQEETLRAKDKNISILEERTARLEEENRSLKKRMEEQELKRSYAAPLPSYREPDRIRTEDDQEHVIFHEEEKRSAMSGHSFWKKWRKQKKTSDRSRRFIDSYIKDEKYTEEQKNFFLDCLEEGMSEAEIARLAGYGLSVEVMKRLKMIEGQRREDRETTEESEK